MAFSFFKKNKANGGEAEKPEAGVAGGAASDAGGGASPGDGNGAGKPADKPKGGKEPFKPDPRKAARWFERAQTVAQTGNHDYAIDCYVGGLKLEPDNIAVHEALYEVAKKRKVAGGKPPGMRERLQGGGRTPVEKFLHAEALWAKDPINLAQMLTVMERAAEAAEAYPELENLQEVVHWVGERWLEFAPSNKKVTKNQFVKVRDLFHQIQSFEKAVEACRYALTLSPDDANLLSDLKNLEAERIMQEAYSKAGKEGGSATFVRDVDKQKDLEDADSLSRSDLVRDQLIARRRAELEEEPQSIDKITRLVDLLEEKGTDEAEAEAIQLLRDAWERSGQYRFKVQMGDIHIKQLNRRLKAAKAAADANPSDAGARAAYTEQLRKTLQFELEEYIERTQNYPTDMRLKYELGKRLFAFKKYDEAIAAFQEAQAEPKNRAACMEYLGRSYSAKGWFDEAVQTLRRGIQTHPLSDDPLAMALRYHLMDALEQSARKTRKVEQAREALAVASEIVQVNINFREIRQRMENLRKLGDELEKPAG